MAIYKRNSTYYYEFELRGHRYRESTKQGNPKKARSLEAARKTQILMGEVGIRDKTEAPAFTTYMTEWLDTYAKTHTKYSTWQSYQFAYDKHLEPAFKGKRLDEITRQDIANLIRKKMHDGLTVATVRNTLAPLRGMLNHAVDVGLITANPALRVGVYMKDRKSKENRLKIRPLTREEVQTLIVTSESTSFGTYAVIFTAVRTGLRMGELFGLQWGDLNFEDRYIEVRRSIVLGRVDTPKSGQLRRVDMSLQLMAVLKELKRQREEEYKGKDMPEWVFINSEGTPLQGHNFRHRIFLGLLEKAGLKGIRFHDLRHTFASLLLQNGESLTYVKEQMGHHSIQVTVDIYGHLIPGSNKAAVDKLDF